MYIYIYMAVSRLFVAPVQALRKHPPAVSTKHSVGHVLLSSRYDLAQFSFNPTFHRAHFILIQTPFSFNQALSRLNVAHKRFSLLCSRVHLLGFAWCVRGAP